MQQIKMAAGDTWQPQEHRQRRSGENGGDGRHAAAAGAGFERDMCHCGAADHAWLRSGERGFAESKSGVANLIIGIDFTKSNVLTGPSLLGYICKPGFELS